MSATALAEPPPPLRRQPEYPFHIGYRPVIGVDADGTPTYTEVPLTEEDFLHPQEGDRFMLVDAHSFAVHYLRHAIRYACRERPEVRLFTDHRIDWQVGGIPPHGPDIVVFDRFAADWDPTEGTLPVADLGLTTLVVIEVTSEATRHVDLGEKFEEYAAVGIPYYLVVDVASPEGDPRLLGFRRVGGGYREMRRDARLGFLVPALALWFRYEDGRVIAADEDGNDIPDSPDLGFTLATVAQEARTERARADAEKTRADEEKARADAATAEAAAEKAIAAELARELAGLKARLASNG